ncbi:hypothetical protein EES47_24795 [Streptomyces sp. ADI98-12]|nr:hypothetical protein EES47_24795 [Streptomyces sp. ADI98-12]
MAAATWSSGVSASGAAWPTPAACTTPVRGASSGTAARTRARASRSALSQAVRVTRAPSSSSSARSPAAPGASGPRRPVRMRWAAPERASHRAASAPRPPVPPVTRTVPEAVNSSSRGRSSPGWRTTRRARVPEARTASWSSPSRVARRLTRRWVAGASSTSGRSIRPLHCSGRSSAATRPSPQAAARAGWVSGSPGPVETAPRVTVHSGAVTAASPSAWARTTPRAKPAGSPPAGVSVPAAPGRAASASGSSDRTPLMPAAPSAPEVSTAARRPAVRRSRSRWEVSRTRRSTAAPCPRRASSTVSAAPSSAVVTASQVPSRTGAFSVLAGCQAIR